jgi:hypothetical protein
MCCHFFVEIYHIKLRPIFLSHISCVFFFLLVMYTHIYNNNEYNNEYTTTTTTIKIIKIIIFRYTGVAMRLLLHEDKMLGSYVPNSSPQSGGLKNDSSQTLHSKKSLHSNNNNNNNSQYQFSYTSLTGKTCMKKKAGGEVDADVTTMVRPKRMLDGRDRLGCTPLHTACVSSPHFRQLKLIKVVIFIHSFIHFFF